MFRAIYNPTTSDGILQMSMNMQNMIIQSGNFILILFLWTQCKKYVVLLVIIYAMNFVPQSVTHITS